MDPDASSIESLPSYGDRVREFGPEESTTFKAHLATIAIVFIVLVTAVAALGVAAIHTISADMEEFEMPAPLALIQSIESDGSVAVVACDRVWGSGFVDGHDLELWSNGQTMRFVAEYLSRTPTRVTDVYVDWGPVPNAGVLIKLDHDTLHAEGLIIRTLDDALAHRSAIVRVAEALRDTHATSRGSFTPSPGDFILHTTGDASETR